MAFDVYIRVSEVGDRVADNLMTTEEQEARARAWVERAGLAVGEVVTELDVSGAKKVDDRELGQLIRKVEAGESDGIVVRYADRYARDMIEGAVALARITEAGGRLIAYDSGFDSANLTPDTRLTFNMLLAVAQAQRERNRENRIRGSKRFADQGGFLCGYAPLGYDRLEDGRIAPNPEAVPLVREAFLRRAQGATYRAIRDYLRSAGADVVVYDERTKKPGKRARTPFATISDSGVQHMLASRAFVGEATVQSEQKGQPEVRKKAHDAMVTETEWERANAVGNGHSVPNGRWSSTVQLAGLVYCPEGHKLKTGAGGRTGKPIAHYSCTAEHCSSRASVDADRVDEHVRELLSHAFLHRAPEIVAIMEGDDCYARAMEAVEEARVELDTYRTEIKVSDVGVEQWKRDVASRQAALDLAREALRAVPPPPQPKKSKGGRPMTFEEAEPGIMREHNARFISRVVVKPVGRGRRVPVEERVDVYLVGSEKPYVIPEPPPVAPDLLAALSASVREAA